MASVSFCWQLDDGSFAGPADQGDFDVVPLIGDVFVLTTAGEAPDAIQVIDRYLVSDGNIGDVWHLIVKHTDLRPEIIKALGLSGSDTKRRWESFEYQENERDKAAQERLNASLKKTAD